MPWAYKEYKAWLIVNGFDDNEKIKNMISLVKLQLESKNEFTVEKYKKDVREQLAELKVDEEEILCWMSFIDK